MINITNDPLTLVADGVLLFICGDHSLALEKLKLAINTNPNCFQAWLAQSEILYSIKNFDTALQTAQNAHTINPDDVHINTTLSRIWIEKGDQKKAEHFSRRARMLGWKELIKNNKKTCEASQKTCETTSVSH